MQRKRVKEEKKIEEVTMPTFASVALFASAIPQTAMLYPIIWADPCSDMFFMCFELSIGWIASLQALESAAFVSLGYLDFQLRHHKDDKLTYAMRKKRLAFAKFSLITSISTLLMLDSVSANCMIPLFIGSLWTTLKMGT